jgi:hypothetical protein
MNGERWKAEGRVRLEVCARCGAGMGPGSPKHVVRIEVLADWDGHLAALEDDEARERAMRDALEAIEDRDDLELLREVYHREVHLLCPLCRDRFLANPFNLPLRGRPA